MKMQYFPLRGGGELPSSGGKYFNVDIYRKNSSKYTQLIFKPYVWNNLNLMYSSLLFLTKKFGYLEMSENRLQVNKLIFCTFMIILC